MLIVQPICANEWKIKSTVRCSDHTSGGGGGGGGIGHAWAEADDSVLQSQSTQFPTEGLSQRPVPILINNNNNSRFQKIGCTQRDNGKGSY